MPESQQSTEQQISPEAKDNDSGATGTEQSGSASGEAKPPWGDEENFDAQRAWDLIQNLRNEKRGLQDRLSTDLATKDQEITNLNDKVTGLQQLESTIQEKDASISDLTGKLGGAEATIQKQELLAAAGIPLTYVDNVVGEDKEAWTASVEQLKALRGESRVQRTRDPVQEAANGGGPAIDKNEEARAFFNV